MESEGERADPEEIPAARAVHLRVKRCRLSQKAVSTSRFRIEAIFCEASLRGEQEDRVFTLFSPAIVSVLFPRRLRVHESLFLSLR